MEFPFLQTYEVFEIVRFDISRVNRKNEKLLLTAFCSPAALATVFSICLLMVSVEEAGWRLVYALHILSRGVILD